MTEERRKEIALMLVEQLIVENGIRGVQQVRQDTGNMAKKLNLQTQELMDFYELLVPKFLGRVFGYSSVRVSMEKKFQVHDQG
ncbi:MAG: hypothetical protein WAX80_02620 [Minisyncoccia bacterium]